MPARCFDLAQRDTGVATNLAAKSAVLEVRDTAAAASAPDPPPFVWIFYTDAATKTTHTKITRAALSSTGYEVQIDGRTVPLHTRISLVVVAWEYARGDKKGRKGYFDIGWAFAETSPNTGSSKLTVYEKNGKKSTKGTVTAVGAIANDAFEERMLTDMKFQWAALKTNQTELKHMWLPLMKQFNQTGVWMTHFYWNMVAGPTLVGADQGLPDLEAYTGTPEQVEKWWDDAVTAACNTYKFDPKSAPSEKLLEVIGVATLVSQGKPYPAERERAEQRGVEAYRLYNGFGDCDFMAVETGALYNMLKTAYAKAPFAKDTLANKIASFFHNKCGKFYVIHVHVPTPTAVGKESSGKDKSVAAHACGLIEKKHEGASPNFTNAVLAECTTVTACVDLSQTAENVSLRLVPFAKYRCVFAAYSGTEAYIAKLDQGRADACSIANVIKGKVDFEKYTLPAGISGTIVRPKIDYFEMISTMRALLVNTAANIPRAMVHAI